MTESPKQRVLILCTGNSCRSQMAEGWWRHYAGGHWDAFSAGLSPKGVHPRAVAAMDEVGIDISGQRSESLENYLDRPFDLVITVCANADAACPTFAAARRREHWPFDDPAAAQGSDEEVTQVFRRVRDEIGARVRAFVESRGQ